MDGKTKRYKHGDYRAFKWFTDTQWDGISERDKAMWTEYSDDEPAPISKEVIEFTEKNNLETKEPCCKEVNECVELRKKVAKLEAEIVQLKAVPTEAPVTENAELDEEAQKYLLKEKLTNLGIKYRPNIGLAKLKEKLEAAENANNTE